MKLLSYFQTKKLGQKLEKKLVENELKRLREEYVQAQKSADKDFDYMTGEAKDGNDQRIWSVMHLKTQDLAKKIFALEAVL